MEDRFKDAQNFKEETERGILCLSNSVFEQVQLIRALLLLLFSFFLVFKFYFALDY